MLNDLGQYSDNLPVASNNLPAPRPQVSTVDISLLFQIGVEQALQNAAPLQVSADVTQSVDTPIIQNIDNNLVLIRDQLVKDSPNSSTEVSKEKKAEKREEILSKEEKKYRDRLLKYQERLLALNEKSLEQRIAASNVKDVRSGLDSLATMLHNPYAILDSLVGKLFAFRPTHRKASDDAAVSPSESIQSTSSSETTSESSITSSSSTNTTESDSSNEEVTYSNDSIFAGKDDAVDVEYSVVDDPISSVATDSIASDTGYENLLPDNTSNSIVSSVAGEDEEEKKFYKNANTANILIADTFENPGDSEFVETLTSQTSTNTESKGGLGVGETILGVALVAALAPHIESILEVVREVIGVLHEDIFPIIQNIYSKVLEPILVETKTDIISIIHAFADLFVSSLDMLKSMVGVVNEVMLAVKPRVNELVNSLADMAKSVFDLVSGVSEYMIKFFQNPVDTMKELGTAIGSGLSAALGTLLNDLVGDLVHGLRMILPESLGGFDKKYKKVELQKMEEEYQARHTERLEMVDALTTSVSTALGGDEGTMATIQAGSVNVYAVAPDAVNSSESESTAGSSTVDNSSATINVYAGAADVVRRPGGSL